MIRDAPPFSLAFFRQIARDDFDEPGVLQPIRRSTTAPKFYLNAHNPRTGHGLLQRQIDVIVNTIRHVVPQITNGRFEAASIEIGASARARQAGVINIDITYEPADNYCGKALVGASMGQIWFNFERCAATCRGEEIGPEIVAHEVGHAMGLWHHGERGIMNPFVTSATCASRDFSEREREHSAVLYSRSPGNTDPDWDHPSTLTVVSGGTSPTVICYR